MKDEHKRLIVNPVKLNIRELLISDEAKESDDELAEKEVSVEQEAEQELLDFVDDSLLQDRNKDIYLKFSQEMLENDQAILNKLLLSRKRKRQLQLKADEARKYKELKRKFCSFVEKYELGAENFKLSDDEYEEDDYKSKNNGQSAMYKVALAYLEKKQEEMLRKHEAAKVEKEIIRKKEKEMKVKGIATWSKKMNLNVSQHLQSCPPLTIKKVNNQEFIERYFKKSFRDD